MRFGLVTYLWGKDWDLPTLIGNCETSGLLGVELRTTHKHGVEPGLSSRERAEVKKRFADSAVTLVGLGSDERFDSPDPAKLRGAIETTKAFIKLSHDVGGSGVKVKPNSFHRGVPRDKTIEQIGKSLNIVGAFGADYGQQIRLEVHGSCAPLPVIRQIMDVADHPNVAVCWNCNQEDLDGEGLAYNFHLVRERLGDTVHVRQLNVGNYPYQRLMNLLAKTGYNGWMLLEARTQPAQPVAAMIEQRYIWERMVGEAQRSKASSRKDSTGSGVRITEQPGRLRVEIEGELFTEYRFKDVPRPYFYPLIGPTGVNITRHWPMEEHAHEEHDHPHHRSLWFSHGAVNGHDFWSEQAGFGKIVHQKFLEVTSGEQAGVIRSANRWVAQGGKVICTDRRTHRFYNLPEGRMIDFEVTICASEGELTLGDTKEGLMAIRVAPTMRVQGEVAAGHIVNSEGIRDKQAWGKRARWCDYYGPLEGQVVGVAIFDHPANPRYPTWWHVRTYGLFAANPFGIHDFEGKPKGTGDLTIAPDESVTFRYRFYFHRGDWRQGRVAEHYERYAAKTPDKLR